MPPIKAQIREKSFHTDWINTRKSWKISLDDLVAGKDTPLTTEAKSQGQKVVSEAKGKAERLLEDVDDLLEQIRGNKKS